MNDIIVEIALLIIVGIILLVVEYRTGWFVSQLKPQGGQGEPTSNSKLGLFKTDWSEATKQARYNLSSIYGINPNEILVVRWDVYNDLFSRQLTLEIRLPPTHAPESAEPDYPHISVKVNREGQILSIHNYWV